MGVSELSYVALLVFPAIDFSCVSTGVQSSCTMQVVFVVREPFSDIEIRP